MKDKEISQIHIEHLLNESTLSEILYLVGVSGSDSKECKNCKHYDSVKMGCNHPHWDKCVKRDDDEFVIDYVYHEYHYR